MSTIANSLNTILNSYTPVLSSSVSAGTVAYTTQFGAYIQVGNLVYCWFNIQGNITGSPSGSLRVSIPFLPPSATLLNSISWGRLVLSGVESPAYFDASSSALAVGNFRRQSTNGAFAVATGNFVCQASIVFSL